MNPIIIIPIVIAFCLLPTVIRSIKLKQRGIGFKWQLERFWNRAYRRAKWSYGIRTFWIKRKLKAQENYIPKDDFDDSLSMDLDIMQELNEKDLEKYRTGLVRRRNLSHEQEIAEDDRKFHERIKREKAEQNVTD
jgi:hypothetical protein